MDKYTAEQVDAATIVLEARACYEQAAMLRAYAAILRQQAGRVDEGTYAAIGKAFREVLADPSVAWRNTGAKEFIDRVCDKTAARAQNTQGDAVVHLSVADEIEATPLIGAARLAHGDYLLHAERARVPTEVTAWVEAKREHKRLVGVYNDRLAYAKQHDLGRVSVDHEYQAMCAQQRVMDALVEPMFNALTSAPSQRAEVK